MLFTLKKILFENIALKFFSLLLALSLWIFVMGEREAEFSFSDVPLALVNVPPGLIITHQTTDSFALRVRGPRGILATLSASALKVTFDLEGAKAGTNFFRNLVDKVKLPEGVKVASISPSEFSLTLEPLVNTMVPVHLTTRGALPEGYELSRVEIFPAFVEVRLGKSEAAELEKVMTEPIDLSGLTGSVEKEVPLLVGDFLSPRTVNVHKVKARIVINERMVEKELHDVKVEARNSTYRTTIIPSRVQVRVKGPYHLIKELLPDSVTVSIDLGGVTPGSYSRKADIMLPSLVTLVEAKPVWFKVLVSKELLGQAILRIGEKEQGEEGKVYARFDGEC